jgi:ribosomal protein L11 methyltransferase
MRTWPAIDVDLGRPGDDLFQAALTDYDVAAIEESTPERWRVFFHSPEERDRALAGLRTDFPALPLASIDVADEDWAARSQASLRSVQIGGIVIAPPWDVPEVVGAGFSRPGITVIIKPSMGFGTGHHATTRLCLAALQQIDLSRKTVLDVGTGSGVLAIAARMLGASDVLGIDDDADAIESARENVALNRGVHVELQVVGLERVVLTPFDVVIANLTGGLLMKMADRLAALVASTGRLVISGFMQSEEIGVLAAFRGFQVVDRSQEDEWMCAMLQREGSFA